MKTTNVNEETIRVTWEMAVEQFENLVKFASKQEALKGTLDGMTSAEDVYQIGMIKLYDCWLKWCVDEEQNKEMDEFAPIFRTSLFRAVRKRRVQHDYSDLEATEGAFNNIPDEDCHDFSDEMSKAEIVQSIRDSLNSELTRKLLDELLNPSLKTLYEVSTDRKRKQMLKSQGKRVNVPKDNTVRMKHIARSLGITAKQYDIAISEIREKAREVLSIH